MNKLLKEYVLGNVLGEGRHSTVRFAYKKHFMNGSRYSGPYPGNLTSGRKAQRGDQNGARHGKIGDSFSILEREPHAAKLMVTPETWTVAKTESLAYCKLRGSMAIPRVEDFFQDDVSTVIVMEVMQGGTLLENWVKDKRNLGIYQLRSDFLEIVKSVATFEDLGIIHNDLSPSNIMLSRKRLHSDEKGCDSSLRIIDFGMCIHYNNSTEFPITSHALRGTAPYLSPEKILGNIHPNSDIFSLGSMLMHAALRDSPFGRDVSTDDPKYIKKMLTSIICTIPDDVISEAGDKGVEPVLLDFVSECWKPALLRPPASELLRHPFLSIPASDDRCLNC